MSQLRGRKAIVTGATRGIGRAIAGRLAADGADVVITGTDAERTVDVATDLASETASNVYGLACNIADEAAVRFLALRAAELLGGVDILVNNASIALRNAITQISFEEWNRVLTTNVGGTFLVTREVLPLMNGHDPCIVNVASQAGKRGEAFISHYAASKAAQINMTKSFALELAPRIRVNAVCPGLVETDMIFEHYQAQSKIHGVEPEQIRSDMLARIPQKRAQVAHSIAAAVSWLASEDALDITGQSINIDGGMVMD